jgi:hydroxymethylbilane synthase
VTGLSTVGYLPREDPRDVLVLRAGVDAPKTIATGSPRRRKQVALLYPAVEFTAIRGNVDTRLKKIADQHIADGTVLAAAGLRRLRIESWPGVVFRPLGFESMVPAVGQGAIAVQCRSADVGLFEGIFDADTALKVGLERAVQLALGAGCQTALGAHATDTALYLYHESVGLKVIPIVKADLAAPMVTVARILAHLGLR